MQIQLNKIKNGVLIARPPEPVSDMRLQRMSQQEVQAAQQPTVTFVNTFEDLCNELKKDWPKEILG